MRNQPLSGKASHKPWFFLEVLSIANESKVTFEEFVTQALKGDTQKHALDFAAFLRARGMVVEKNHSQVTSNGKVMCYLHIGGEAEMPGPWTIWPNGDFCGIPIGFVFDESMKEIAWAHVNICGSCGGQCAPGSHKTLFGKEFDNVCGAVMAFTDPNAAELECVKKLLEMKMC